MRNYRVIWVLAALLLAALYFANQPTSEQLVHLSGPTMGTTYNVKFAGVENESAEAIQKDIDDLLVHINKLMSTYDPTSELSLFNQQKNTEPYLLSAETALVVKEAIRLGQMSNSVLDITVGPLVNLWGFGPQARPEKTPSNEEIDSIRAYVGLDKIVLTGQTLQKLHPDVYVDLSTIAKGYGVDQVAELLASKGITDYLVEIGGEMRVAGVKPNGDPWRIAVEKPVTEQRAIQSILVVGNNAVATSGDYRNYFEQDGVRYSHLIDPRTGSPIQHNTVAVTVVHPSSMTADGLATALIVLGKDQALALAQREGLDVLIITKENGEFKEYTSGSFNQYVIEH